LIMGTETNIRIPYIMLIASLSSSVLSLPYELSENLPAIKPGYSHINDIAGWKEMAFNTPSDYSIINSDAERIQVIVDFSKNIIENSVDIDNEFVEIVNENFWDLI
jgi:hypothetical protein